MSASAPSVRQLPASIGCSQKAISQPRSMRTPARICGGTPGRWKPVILLPGLVNEPRLQHQPHHLQKGQHLGGNWNRLPTRGSKPMLCQLLTPAGRQTSLIMFPQMIKMAGHIPPKWCNEKGAYQIASLRYPNESEQNDINCGAELLHELVMAGAQDNFGKRRRMPV